MLPPNHLHRRPAWSDGGLRESVQELAIKTGSRNRLESLRILALGLVFNSPHPLSSMENHVRVPFSQGLGQLIDSPFGSPFG